MAASSESRRTLVAAAALAAVAFPPRARTVTNVRAQQLADRSVEVLYDLSGAAAGRRSRSRWDNFPGVCRSAFRNADSPSLRARDVGIRLGSSP